MKPHPSTFYPELTDQRLAVIADALLATRYDTIQELSTTLDCAYTRETTAFGRSRNKLIQMCLFKKYDWLSLANPGMDITFKIGNVPCRFFRDNPDQPGKRGFFNRNAVDDLFAIDDTHPVMWRFIVDRALNDEDEDRVYFFGFNAYQEPVSQWLYTSAGPILHSVDDYVPPAAEIPPAQVDVRDDDVEDQDADEAQNE